ncbi:MAG TPA: hypothetical protein VJL32_03905 [Candidatus Paceibacterota bacterium]
MSGEKIKFRPTDTEEMRQWQDKVAADFAIEHDSEYFLVPIKLKDGTKQTHHVPIHSKLEMKGVENVTHEEMIRAIQKILPTMDKPDLKEALLILRGEKKPTR